MPSRSFIRWESDELPTLDQLDQAHQAVGGHGVGRRTATQQINDAYIVLLAGKFQQYCRNLHTEAATAIAASIMPLSLRNIVLASLTRSRALDNVNAQPGSLGSDFGLFGMALWPTLTAQSPRNATRQTRLDQLNVWRNKVAHQDFNLKSAEQAVVADTRRTLRWVRVWRSAVEGLASEMDDAVLMHLTALLGTAPW
jgi:hypothetical protein